MSVLEFDSRNTNISNKSKNHKLCIFLGSQNDKLNSLPGLNEDQQEEI